MKKNDTWMIGRQFADKYGVTLQALYTHRVYHDYDVAWCKHMPVNGIKDKIHVNETYLLKVAEFKTNIQLEAQDLYFKLQEHMKMAVVSRYLVKTTQYTNVDSWNTMLSQRLFEQPHDKSTILNTRVNNMMLLFVRRGRKLLKDTL